MNSRGNRIVHASDQLCKVTDGNGNVHVHVHAKKNYDEEVPNGDRIYMLVMIGKYLMETVMYMLVIMVKLPRGIMVRKSGSTPGSLSIRWNVLVFRDMLENTK
jgi:hypothetical protein